MESDVTRRGFLKSAARTTAGLGALSGITFLAHPERVLGANDRVRVAVCGLHGRGKNHLSAYSHLANVEIAALCDVDEDVLKNDAEKLVVTRKAMSISASCWKTHRLTPSPLLPLTTGTR